MALLDVKKQEAMNKPIILVVDGDISFLDELQRVLKKDYSVITTGGGLEALRLINELTTLHVMVITNDMPRLKGTEILRYVHESVHRPESIVKILIMDSPSSDNMVESAKIGRIDAILTKPVTPDFIRRKIAYLLARRSKEKRATMRINFGSAVQIQIDREMNTETELVNISENGMFLRTLYLHPKGSTLPFKILLPSGKEYEVLGRIVRIDTEQGGIGVEFLTLDNGSRASLLQSISDYITLRDLTKLKARYPFLKTEEMVLFSDNLKIETFLREAMESGVEIVAMPAQGRMPEILGMTEINPPLYCLLNGEELDIKFKTSDLVFISFQLGYASYNFESMVCRISKDGKQMDCLYPRVMFYSEKRNEKRIDPFGKLQIEIPLPPPFHTKIRGHITDISYGGASFIADRDAPVLLKGTPLERVCIFDGDNLLWKEKGEVRYVTWAGKESAGQMKYGIQFGIARMSIQTTQTPELDPGHSAIHSDKNKSHPRMNLAASLSELAHKPPEVIRVENQRGEEIVGLLNSSLPLNEKPIPVVLIPPAFGKTKETLFSLVLTLIENFYLLEKPLAVIRYDGIRRKGESHKDPDASEPPYELINADFSQGAADIKAMMDWLSLNPRLQASSVVLISFSLSALEARIVLRDEAYRRRISYWISCMGTPEFRDLMTRINCGLDFLEQFKLGIKLGVMPVLGNLVSVDPYVADGVDNAVATLEQAKEDMQRFDIPITWIYGQYDKWVKTEFIREIMSVQADAPREVISVPTGHNARTSEEALRLFGTMTSLIHRFFHKKMIQPILPSKKNLEVMRRAEKDRLPLRNLKNRKAYWQRYLIGETNLLGFDIMAMADEYKQLMHDQLKALELTPKDRLLDLGCGTGNFIENLLENDQLPAKITIADLIPEGMKKAYQKLVSRSKVLKEPGRFDLLCLDLELSRFLPVRRFLNGEIGSFIELADKIENLNLESAEKIQKVYSPRLHRILRGESVTPALDDWLKSQFDILEYRTIIDFNQAARYIRQPTTKKPSFHKLVFPGSLEGTFHLPVKPGWYNKILMSLVLSYIFNPSETLYEVKRIIRPEGLLVLSSMRPDTDASGPFTRLMEKIEGLPAEELPPEWPKPILLESLRSFLNDAQALVDLEEAGTFDFFDPEKLEGLLEDTGWDIVQTIPTYGDPPQGYIMVAKVRDTNGKTRNDL